jgi:uncharacterized protein
MVTEAEIGDVVAGIVRRFAPLKVVLFGSYAVGTPREDPDVDLLLIMAYTGSAAGCAAQIARTIRAPFDVDIVIHSPDEVAQRLSWNDRFLRSILGTGRVLHGSRDR